MYKILVVEDDDRLNKAVCKYINNHGYEGIDALDAMYAYDAMYHTKFDLIISDIMMLDIDGFEFAETVRETDKTISILFMVARDDMPSKSRGYCAGIDNYMVKPINFEELLLYIGALLRRAGIMNNRILTIGNMVIFYSSCCPIRKSLFHGRRSWKNFGTQIPRPRFE